MQKMEILIYCSDAEFNSKNSGNNIFAQFRTNFDLCTKNGQNFWPNFDRFFEKFFDPDIQIQIRGRHRDLRPRLH